MASIGELSVIIKANDQFTPTLKKVNTSLRTNMAAVRQLGYGITYLGTSFLAMGFALKQSNSALGQTVGNMMMTVGAIATAIGSSFQFIAAIGKMVNALRTLATWQMITKALSGPWGWAALAGAVAVAGVSISATNKKVAETTTSKSKVSPVIINNFIDGKKVSGVVRTNIIADQNRNGTSGIR
jgi:vacuolar-type H+-ATPase subunit I/STV1